MSKRNCYEIITSLSFDPPEKDKDKIEYEIDFWACKQKFKLDKGLGSELEREELNSKENIRKILTDAESRKKEASEMKEVQCEKLNAIIEIIKRSRSDGIFTISMPRIKSISECLRLSQMGTVKESFEKAGFTIVKRKKISNSNAIFLESHIFDYITEKISELNKEKNSKYPWLDKVTNLYDLAAYIQNDEANIKKYPEKDAEELKKIMSTWTDAFSNPSGSLTHCFLDLFSKGKTQVFKDKETKKKYDYSLSYFELKPLFSMIKRIPEQMRMDPFVANMCIGEIQKYFKGEELAVEIYNKEACNKEDYVREDNDIINVVCGNCKSINRINYIKEERSSCKCKTCSSLLFMRCPNETCSSFIPVTSEICPECGYSLIEAQFFDKYFTLTQIAIDSMDLIEAKKQFALAKKARPNDIRLKRLEEKLQQKVSKVEKPLQGINSLIMQKKYMEARNELSSFCSMYPEINVGEIKTSIDKSLALADKMYSQIEGKTDICDKCYDILDIVSDYKKALDHLKKTPPKPVRNVNVLFSNESNSVSLNWSNSGEREISYYVIRKENSFPESINDGLVLVDNRSITNYIDKSVQPGVPYYYAVFSYRMGNYSAPVYSNKVFIIKELDKQYIKFCGDDGKCVISWNLPSNAYGVRVIRGITKGVEFGDKNDGYSVFENVKNGLEDTNVTNGMTYFYRLQVIYSEGKSYVFSKGIVVSITPDSKPLVIDLMDISAVTLNSAVIKWSFPQSNSLTSSPGFIDFYDVIKPIEKGTELPVDQIDKIGNKIGTVSDVMKRETTLVFSEMKRYNIIAVTKKGQIGVISNTVFYSNFECCEFDTEKCKLSKSNNTLQLVFKNPIPNKIKNIYYSVGTKNNDYDDEPWDSVETLNNMHKISVDQYIKDKLIFLTGLPKKKLYISVISEYLINGQYNYSNTAKLIKSNVPPSIIYYKFEMEYGITGRVKSAKVYIWCNDLVDNIPGLLVCGNVEQESPISINDIKNIIVLDIPVSKKYMPGEILVYNLPLDKVNIIKKGFQIKMFIKDNLVQEYELSLQNFNSSIIK